MIAPSSTLQALDVHGLSTTDLEEDDLQIIAEVSQALETNSELEALIALPETDEQHELIAKDIEAPWYEAEIGRHKLLTFKQEQVLTFALRESQHAVEAVMLESPLALRVLANRGSKSLQKYAERLLLDSSDRASQSSLTSSGPSPELEDVESEIRLTISAIHEPPLEFIDYSTIRIQISEAARELEALELRTVNFAASIGISLTDSLQILDSIRHGNTEEVPEFAAFEARELAGDYTEWMKARCTTPSEFRAQHSKILEIEDRVKPVKHKLLCANLRLAMHFAKKYIGSGADREEVKDAAVHGLNEGIDRFKPELGNKLSTLASWYILKEIKAYLRDKKRRRGIDPDRFEKFKKHIEAKLSRGKQIFDISPTAIAIELGWPKATVVEYLGYWKRLKTIVSLDFENRETESALKDSIPEPTDRSKPQASDYAFDLALLRSVLREAIIKLPPAAQKYLALMYPLRNDQETRSGQEAAKLLGATKQAASNSWLKAKEQLIELLKASPVVKEFLEGTQSSLRSSTSGLSS